VGRKPRLREPTCKDLTGLGVIRNSDLDVIPGLPGSGNMSSAERQRPDHLLMTPLTSLSTSSLVKFPVIRVLW
jgi:hypothetical protein